MKRIVVRLCIAACLVLLCWLAFSRMASGSLESTRHQRTIIVSINGNPNRTAGFDSLIAAYNKIHPEVKVKLEPKGGHLGTGYNGWLTAQMASGDPRPDIVSSNYCAATEGFVNFDYYRHVINPYTGNPWNEDFNFDWFSWYTPKGERTMLPCQAVHITWFYNKDIFDELDLKPPQTWREFMDACAKIKAAGRTPTSLFFDYRYYQWLAEILWDQYSRPFIQVIRAQPGDWCYNQDVDGNWRYDPKDPFNDKIPTINQARILKAIRDGDIRYDTPEFMQCLRNLKEISQYTPSNFMAEARAGQGAGPYDTFLKQDAVMHLGGTWALPMLDKDMHELKLRADAGKGAGTLRPFRWGTFDTPPQMNEWVVGSVRSVESAAGPYISIVDKNQPQTDAAMDFVMFWLSGPGYQAYIDGDVADGAFNPAGKPFVNGVTMPPRHEEMFAKVRMIGNAEYKATLLPFGFPPPSTPLALDLREALTNYIHGQTTVQEAAASCQSIVRQAVPARMKSSGIAKKFVDNPALDPGG